MSYLTELEKQQLQFDWRYRGVSVLNLLTEEEVDEYNKELERIRLERQENDTESKGISCIMIFNRCLENEKNEIFHAKPA